MTESPGHNALSPFASIGYKRKFFLIFVSFAVLKLIWVFNTQSGFFGRFSLGCLAARPPESESSDPPNEMVRFN